MGLAFPALLLPGACWHVLRTWGWSIAFPDDARPGFARLFRVRLAADAISFFTIRGVTGEPLKIMLLYDQVAAPIATAAITLERLAFAIVSLVIAGVVSTIAVRLLAMPGTWDALFTLLSMATVIALGILAEIARHRKGDYLGRLVTRVGRLVGRPLESSRVVRFVLEVEEILNVEEDYEVRVWRARTRHGLRTFQTRLDEWPWLAPDGGHLIRDLCGDLFRLPPLERMDAKSRRWLWAYVG